MSFKNEIIKAKIRLLQMHYESKVGHIGGNLSAIDLLICLYHKVIQPEDVFILSKGHSAGALYITLWSLDKLTDNELKTFHKDNTKLGGHPPAKGIKEIKFATGSLGHGLSLAAGLGLGKKMKNEKGIIFCLLSDGELNEGSCWEALIFIKHHNLSNVVILVDKNNLQGFGKTKEIADISPLKEKFEVFGFVVDEINGHNPQEIIHSLKGCFNNTLPRVIIAHTTKGAGVSYMENKMEWHYLPMSEEQYTQAVKEINLL